MTLANVYNLRCLPVGAMHSIMRMVIYDSGVHSKASDTQAMSPSFLLQYAANCRAIDIVVCDILSHVMACEVMLGTHVQLQQNAKASFKP